MRKPHHLLLFLLVIGIKGAFLFGQTTANFSAVNTADCSPFAFSLIDESTSPSNITSWSWTNNGDFFSNQQNPSGLLIQSNFYDICLTVTAANGSSDTECKNNFLEVFNPPVPSFNSNVVNGCAPLEVNFTNTSTTSSSSLAGVTWDFGGSCGVVTAGANEAVSCVYEVPGIYQVTIIVEDSNGCLSTLTLPDYIEVFPEPAITVSLASFDNCELPIVIDVQNDGNVGLPIVYDWDFGNGTSQTTFDPNPIQYNASGPFSISVVATNTETQCTASLTLPQTITELSPSSFTFERTTDCGLPEIAFENTSPGIPTTINWDFGDGTSSALASPVHLFPAFGCYTITMTRVIDGCTKTLSQEVCIEEINPANVITNIINPAGCNLPHSSQFSVVASATLNYNWDFGDGTTSTQTSPNHTYTDFGDYNVVLTITDDLGCSVPIDVGLIAVQPITIIPGSLGAGGCIPLTINENPTINTFDVLTSINWELYNPAGVLIAQSNLTNPSFQLLDPGCYTVILSAINQSGCQFQQTFNNAYCAGTLPIANFSFDPMIGCADQVFSFTDLSSSNVDFWVWDFEGDGLTDAFTPDAMHEYNVIDCFMPTLTVADNGCTNSISLGPLCIEPPATVFTAVIDCDVSGQVAFVSTSLGADSLAWDFGVAGTDQDTSSQVATTFVYPDLGSYNTTLVSYNFMTGCTDTATLAIELMEPQASFVIDTKQLCFPAEVLPINTSISAETYSWQLPAGGTISGASSATPVIQFDAPGTYAIELEITDANTCANSFLVDNIQVGGPEVDFSFSVVGDCIPFEVNLQDASSNLFFTNDSWEWDIADGMMNGTGENFGFTMDSVGVFSINLTVEDNEGCRQEITQSIGLNENSPLANFNGLLIGCNDVSIQFNDASLGTSLMYAWNFGDGNTSTEISPEHIYENGAYEACLTVMDSNCENVYCDSVFIQDVVADFTVDSSYSSCTPSTVSFINNSANSSTYQWNFGDETGASDNIDASHIYTANGIFDVSVVAYGENQACTDTLTIEELISIVGPGGLVDFNLDDFCIPSDMLVNVDTDRPYDVTVFYGDGNTAELLNITSGSFLHTYQSTTNDGFAPSVLLIESNNPACLISVASPDTFTLSELSIDFEIDREQLCDTNRDVLLSGIINSTSAYTVNWIIPNGEPSTGDGEDLLVNFSELGPNDISFFANNENCQDSIIKLGAVEVFEVVELNPEDYAICPGDSVQTQITGVFDVISWNNPQLLTSDTIADPIAFPSETTTFTIEASVGPCPAITEMAEVVVYSLPSLEVDQGIVYYPGEEVIIGPVNPPVSGFDYQWSPIAGLSCVNCPNPKYLLDSTHTYTLNYTAVETGCERDVDISIRPYTQCPPMTLTLPNVFTPNDDGNNDDFLLFADLLEEIETFRIFDRWGETVFVTTDKNEKWDGRMNGKFVLPGVYVYLVEYICPLDGVLVQVKGDLAVLR